MTPTDLRTLRTRLGWSQQRLAAALGVYQGTVSRWEGGVSPLPPYLGLALTTLQASAPVPPKIRRA